MSTENHSAVFIKLTLTMACLFFQTGRQIFNRKFFFSPVSSFGKSTSMLIPCRLPYELRFCNHHLNFIIFDYSLFCYLILLNEFDFWFLKTRNQTLDNNGSSVTCNCFEICDNKIEKSSIAEHIGAYCSTYDNTCSKLGRRTIQKAESITQAWLKYVDKQWLVERERDLSIRNISDQISTSQFSSRNCIKSISHSIRRTARCKCSHIAECPKGRSMHHLDISGDRIKLRYNGSPHAATERSWIFPSTGKKSQTKFPAHNWCLAYIYGWWYPFTVVVR